MSNQTAAQVLPAVREIIDEQLSLYRTERSIQVVNTVPPTPQIPGNRKPNHWLRIPDVTCVFVDMKGSTQLSATIHEKGTAGAYQLFTGTAVEMFHEFGAAYIDVRGDGVFALFDRNQIYLALAAAVTFKTFAREDFAKELEAKAGLEVGAHIGIDRKTVLVRKLGLNRYGDRTDRQNEVWAGKPVNMASKLAALGESDQLHISDRYFAHLKDEKALRSCGCRSGGAPGKLDLWTPVDVSNEPQFDFDTAYRLTSAWCPNHGREYCEAILALDPS